MSIKSNLQEFIVAGFTIALIILIMIFVYHTFEMEKKVNQQGKQIGYILREQAARERQELKDLKMINRTSSRDRIPDDNILIYRDKIIIMVNDSTLSHYAGTGSMLPGIFKGANGFSLLPGSTDDLVVDDVISFTRDGKNYVIHRIVEIGEDNLGWFCITKGDNNPVKDQEKVRFNQIGGVLIGIVY